MELKHEPWHHLELVATEESITSLMNVNFDRSVDAIKEVETNILYMMQSSKEWSKANKQFEVEGMHEVIEVTINDQPFQAEVGFEMSDGIITDINTLFVIVDGLHWNMNYLIEPLKADIEEDIINNLKGRIE